MGNHGSNLGMKCIRVKVMEIQWNKLMQIWDTFQKKKMNKIFTRADSRDKICDTSDKRWKWEEACWKENEINSVFAGTAPPPFQALCKALGMWVYKCQVLSDPKMSKLNCPKGIWILQGECSGERTELG